ncbi:glutaredoxin family protein [Patescibacteria group bacterium]|nr:glutaredoxin family protein [Patescibacteria group bacterium]MDE1946721.1 glutaredoxin family protein [Patescibacteria group bacterium]MDE2010976.1 glutaredoxin family protein [Patescibacteria group bacterium]MDE2232819.1 glutaredoxin family protein [Patescibacteria group bacterium]
MQKTVTIYSTPTCVYCNMAKSFFKTNNVDYTEYNVASDMDKRKEMIDKTGQMGVPVIDLGGEIVVGFNEEKLKSSLGIS